MTFRHLNWGSKKVTTVVWGILLAVSIMQPAYAGEFVIESKSQWLEWSFPQKVLSIDPNGGVTLRHFRREINAVADAAEFSHPDAKNNEVFGGIRNAGSNLAQAGNLVDGDPETWWQPDINDPVDLWWIEVDLGRIVQASAIRLMFPDGDEATPLQEFSLYISEGARQVIGQDVFLFDRVGGTTLPNRDTQLQFDLVTIEQGGGTGEHLYTTQDDTLRYRPVQYIRILSQAKNLNGAIAEIEVDALGDNIALDYIERGGSLRSGQNVQNIYALADGSAANWWTGDGRAGVDWRESGAWWEWDLGTTFWLDQLTLFEPAAGFATTGHTNSHQIFFEIFTSDGTPVPTIGESTIQQPFDYQLLSYVDNSRPGRSGRNLNFDFRFPRRKIRYLFYHHGQLAPVEGCAGCTPGFHYNIFEVLLYGQGFPAEVIMESNFIDLGGTKSLRTISWDADVPSGTSVEIRSRTGDSLSEVQFFYDKNGNEIAEKRWNKLPKSQKLDVVVENKISPDWSGWSQVYNSSGQEFLSPSPRKLIQLDVRLKTEDPDVSPQLNSIKLEFDEPILSGGVFAEVIPREARLDSLTNFALKIGGQANLSDRGFDQLTLILPGVLTGEPELHIGAVRVAITEHISNADSLLIRLPQFVREDSVVISLPLRLTSDAAAFVGFVSSSRSPGVMQGIRPNDAHALTVFVPDIALGSSLIRKFELDQFVLTPNGDGVNDILYANVLVVKTDRVPGVTIYDLAGRKIGIAAPVGADRFAWDGRDHAGVLVKPGAYILEAAVKADIETERQHKVIHLAY